VTNSDPPEMPWADIFYRTGQVAVGALVLFTSLCAAQLSLVTRVWHTTERAQRLLRL